MPRHPDDDTVAPRERIRKDKPTPFHGKPSRSRTLKKQWTRKKRGRGR